MAKAMATQQTFNRFTVDRRIEHAVLIISFTLLGLTGLIQKYSQAGVSDALIGLLGGIQMVRIIHRIAATVFLLETVYHLVLMGYKLFVLRGDASMMIGPKDLVDAVQSAMHNLGFKKPTPKMGRYSFAEKMEYWALLWGLVVMSITGFMLWNPVATTRYLPGIFIPTAKVAHGLEAVLAVVAIILWHFYHVHIRRWNSSMFNGKISREEMEEDHALELEKIEAGKTAASYIDPVVLKKRQGVYFPIAAVISVVLLFAIFKFVTFEQTAITTLPQGETAPAVVIQTPTAAPTRVPTATVPVTEGSTGEGTTGGAALTWAGGIGEAFKTSCGACHGTLGGFSAGTYTDVMKQVKPGDAEGSQLVKVQEGAHPGTFSADVLQQVKDWINAGAPEK